MGRNRIMSRLHGHTFTALVAACLFMGAGCRSADDLHILSGTVSGGGIGDDICAVMLKIDVHVLDRTNHPIPGAELWRIHETTLEPPEPTRAERIGESDIDGHIATPSCYMGSSEFATWQPEVKPVRIALMVVRDGYGSKRMEFMPPANEVLAAGNLLGIPPGKAVVPGQPEPPRPPDARNRAYVVSVEVVLRTANE